MKDYSFCGTLDSTVEVTSGDFFPYDGETVVAWFPADVVPTGYPAIYMGQFVAAPDASFGGELRLQGRSLLWDDRCRYISISSLRDVFAEDLKNRMQVSKDDYAD